MAEWAEIITKRHWKSRYYKLCLITVDKQLSCKPQGIYMPQSLMLDPPAGSFSLE